MRTLVHLSDLHFGRTDARVLDALAAAVRETRPDLVAVSGDLTQRARAAQFAAARAFLQSLPRPQIVVPGNHDVPLYDLPRRLLAPLGRYARYISADLEPAFRDDTVAIVGLNSVRAGLFGGGRLNATQVERAARWLRSAGSRLKVVVTHHPFDLPAGHDESHLVGRSAMAMARLARAGADLFLAGHLHLSHIGHTAERYRIAGHSALVVQAGTLSTRGRGEPNTFNVLRVTASTIVVERHAWHAPAGRFQATPAGTFLKTLGQWTRLSAEPPVARPR